MRPVQRIAAIVAIGLGLASESRAQENLHVLAGADQQPASGEEGIGLPLFLLLGSPYVHGRRHAIQAMANNTGESTPRQTAAAKA